RFEASWKTGRQPDIGSVLHEVPESAQPELLVCLLPLDLEYRHRRGEVPEMDTYARRFPQHRSTIEALFQRDQRLPDTIGPVGDMNQLGFALGPIQSTDRVVTARTSDGVSTIMPTPLQIGKFEVVRPLKRGGQASALLAFDPDLKRHVVLKL